MIPTDRPDDPADADADADADPDDPADAGADPGLEALDVLVFYTPREATRGVLDAVFAAGAGRFGDYEECCFISEGTGTFRPLRDARPVLGHLGELETVPEHRVELVLPRRLRGDVVAALLAAHPYEVPAWHILRATHETPAAGAARAAGAAGAEHP